MTLACLAAAELDLRLTPTLKRGTGANHKRLCYAHPGYMARVYGVRTAVVGSR